ncbi:MAG: hypothetical protein MNPFHGCM_02889 [Gemmatimonadaceae bacterium]|nr:hypothetical protein [Gemmatimonadaceae bacterium]
MELDSLLAMFRDATGCKAIAWLPDRTGMLTSIGATTEFGNPEALESIAVAGGAVDVDTPAGRLCVVAVPGVRGCWVGVAAATDQQVSVSRQATFLAAVVGQVVRARLDADHAARELAERYEEINLLYSTSEILGRTVTFEEAAREILVEISETVGARRAAILMHDPSNDMLQVVTAIGFDATTAAPIAVGDERAASARAFRDRRALILEPGELEHEGESYRCGSMLSVPIRYAYPGQDESTLGVVNLSERRTGEAFSRADEKLVSAIASQIGTAVQNARLVRASLIQHRLQHEVQLAGDLQRRLLPDPGLVAPDATVAARVVPVERVGGDFYHLFRLGGGKTGVMIGDVSGMGYPAAMIMALLMSAASIHAQAAADPVDMLLALLTSLEDELTATGMHVSVFYAVIDAPASRLRFANAGHPHAFVVGASGGIDRLSAQVPPLGLGDDDVSVLRQTWTSEHHGWERGRDLLLLFTDGVSDARNSGGERFSEKRLTDLIRDSRQRNPVEIVDHAFAVVRTHVGDAPALDDLTLVVARA